MTRRHAILAAAIFLAACSRQTEPGAQDGDAARPMRAAAGEARPVIVAFGDSLTAGYGLQAGESYADDLQKELDRRGYVFRVVNQGISGDTTSGGLTRIDEALALKPKVVILELGANDGLRGTPVEATRQNLAAMIDAFQRAGARVLLCGMTLPRNYGPDYIRSFERVFFELAKEKKTALMPFFLEGVAARRELMQADGLHPNARGAAAVARNVMPYLVPLLRPVAPAAAARQ
jgi:acyl-CoA thioesterase-1